jgi:hypothetical protein
MTGPNHLVSSELLSYIQDGDTEDDQHLDITKAAGPQQQIHDTEATAYQVYCHHHFSHNITRISLSRLLTRSR